MKSYFLFFLLLLTGVFLISGCNNSSGDDGPVKTGTASFQIQWPDQANNNEARAVSNSDEKTKSLASNAYTPQVELSNECEARGVATVKVEVRDEHERNLVSKRFDCELGEGLIEGIAVGTDRRFVISGLDNNGHERYHGEKSGVAIETGVNEIGMIEMLDVTSAPSVEITAPSDGSLFETGSEVSFECIVTDAEDGALSGDALVWTSDIDGQFGTGAAVNAADLSQGIHTITMTATDSDGNTGSGTITLTVNARPGVLIEAPEAGAVYTEGAEVLFAGSATDAEDGDLTGTALIWTSSLDDQIGTGSSFSISYLSTGTHTVTLTAMDSDGSTGSATVTLTVNARPGVLIEAPEAGAVYTEGAEVLFAGSATDAEDGGLTGTALVWTSSLDDQIGTGSSFSRSDLTPGTHTITLTATDSDGAAITASIDLIINALPIVTIIRPYDGSVHSQSGNIYFDGSVSDPEDGAIDDQSALVWTSDIDDTIGFGSSFMTSSLSSGNHQITLTATDSHDATGSDSVSISVIVPELPDTGQTQSYTTTYGEDSDYTGNPPSYAKLDENGQELLPTANSWAMVRDNVTGLVWEVKTTDSSIHEVEDTYTWSNADAIFIENLNSSGFGGFSDWRLPTVMELFTIVSGAYSNTAINRNYFPNRPDTTDPWYWSATPNLSWSGDYWVIDFTYGEARNYEGDPAYYVRAVRGPELSFGRFVDNGDGTVTDLSTGLMWQQEIEYYPDTWENLITFCEEDLTLAGYTDWRMPNRHELHSLVDYTQSGPAIETSYFQYESGDYWTSTTNPGDTGEAYTVNFSSGSGFYNFKSDYYPIVRAVRGGR